MCFEVAGKQRAVYKNDSAGQRRPEERGKIIGVRKTDEHRNQHDRGPPSQIRFSGVTK